MVKFLSFPIPAKKEAAIKAKKHRGRGEKLSYTRPVKIQVLEPTPVSKGKPVEEVKPKKESLRMRLSRHEN